METYLSQQTIAFLWSVALGAGLGVFYDWFRIGRILRKKWWLTVFLEDLIFALASALVTAFCFTLTNYGQVRLFLLMGELLGFVVYFNTAGVLVVWQARQVARFLRWIRSILRRFGGFLRINLQKIMNFFKKPFIFLERWCRINLLRYATKFSRRIRRGEKQKHGKSE